MPDMTQLTAPLPDPAGMARVWLRWAELAQTDEDRELCLSVACRWETQIVLPTQNENQ